MSDVEEVKGQNEEEKHDNDEEEVDENVFNQGNDLIEDNVEADF